MRDNGSPEYIEIASIVRDGHGLGTQLREVIDPDTVERYAEDMARDDVFPLVDLVEVGDGTYLIAAVREWRALGANLGGTAAALHAEGWKLPPGASTWNADTVRGILKATDAGAK